jgi:RNA-directed DNA polymerase
LKVNKTKSAVDLPQKRKFLGFTLTGGSKPHRRKIAPESLDRFRAKVRQITRRNRGRSLKEVIGSLTEYLIGWRGYFGYCETPSVLRDLDSWVRRRLRCYQWKQWKIYHRRKAELVKLGVSEEVAHATAWSAKGPWRLSHALGVQMALNQRFFDSQGLPRLAAP